MLDVSFNGLGGTLPTALTTVSGGLFAGNCYDGFPPLRGCDGYFLGSVGGTCTATCTAAHKTCAATIVTNDSPYILQNILEGRGAAPCDTGSAEYVRLRVQDKRDACIVRHASGRECVYRYRACLQQLGSAVPTWVHPDI